MTFLTTVLFLNNSLPKDFYLTMLLDHTRRISGTVDGYNLSSMTVSAEIATLTRKFSSAIDVFMDDVQINSF